MSGERSAGLNFVVILLPKAMEVGRDHLIHRKRSPFPYEGKALTRFKLGQDCECRARHCQIAASEALPHHARPGRALLLNGVKAFPS